MSNIAREIVGYLTIEVTNNDKSYIIPKPGYSIRIPVSKETLTYANGKRTGGFKRWCEDTASTLTGGESYEYYYTPLETKTRVERDSTVTGWQQKLEPQVEETKTEPKVETKTEVTTGSLNSSTIYLNDPQTKIVKELPKPSRRLRNSVAPTLKSDLVVLLKDKT